MACEPQALVRPLLKIPSSPSRRLSAAVGTVTVANAPDRLDVRRVRGIVAELAPQVRHVDVHDVLVPHEVRTPYPVEKLLTCHHHARFSREERQQVELEGAELDRLASDDHRAPSQIEREVPTRPGGLADRQIRDASIALRRRSR